MLGGMATKARRGPVSEVSAVAVLGGDPIWPIASILRCAGVAVLDGEPPPKQVGPNLAERYGFSAASVRAGTLGDPRLLAQLLRCVVSDTTPNHLVWTDGNGLFRDATRAIIEPGTESLREVVENFRAHVAALRKIIKQADLLVFLLRDLQIVEDGKGLFFPAPLTGMRPPKGCKIKSSPNETDALKEAFRTSFRLIQELRPDCKVRLICPDQSESVRALAVNLAEEDERIMYHPLVDELVARLRLEGQITRLGALLAKVLHASDVVTVLADLAIHTDEAEPSESAPEDESSLRKASRKARRAARGRRKDEENAQEQIVCEDELLEAFS